MIETSASIHSTAAVSAEVRVGAATRGWNCAQIREGAHICATRLLGKHVAVEFGVTIGKRVKVQNNVSVHHGATIEGGGVIGPHDCFRSDPMPRAITPQGARQGNDGWTASRVVVRSGAAIGPGTLPLPGIEIDRFALVGAASVATRSAPDHGLVFGNPARLHGYVCVYGRCVAGAPAAGPLAGGCPHCGRRDEIATGERFVE